MAIAFQANTGDLYWYSFTGDSINTGQPMKAGTSPNITAQLTEGWVAAVQANTGDLYWYAYNDSGNTGLGMMAGTSPSICPG